MGYTSSAQYTGKSFYEHAASRTKSLENWNHRHRFHQHCSSLLEALISLDLWMLAHGSTSVGSCKTLEPIQMIDAEETQNRIFSQKLENFPKAGGLTRMYLFSSFLSSFFSF
jgi:hypothetical protein